MEIELGLKKPVSKGEKFGFTMKKAKDSGSFRLSGSLFHPTSSPRNGFSAKKKTQGLGIAKLSGALTHSAPASSAPSQHVSTTLRPMSGFRPLTFRAMPPEPTRFRHAALVMKGSSSGMCVEQLADYKAACDGKITWQQYFQKWGNTFQITPT